MEKLKHSIFFVGLALGSSSVFGSIYHGKDDVGDDCEIRIERSSEGIEQISVKGIFNPMPRLSPIKLTGDDFSSWQTEYFNTISDGGYSVFRHQEEFSGLVKTKKVKKILLREMEDAISVRASYIISKGFPLIFGELECYYPDENNGLELSTDLAG